MVTGAIYGGNTSYMPSDPIYFISRGQTALLSYTSPDTGANYNFEWTRHNPLDNSWNQVIHTGTGNSTSFSIPGPGGYQLRVTRGPGDEVLFRCWVFESSLGSASVEVVFEDCFSLVLMARNDSLPLVYRDPATGREGFARYGRQFQWTATPTLAMGQGQRVEIAAPVENTRFDVTITDVAGNRAQANINYTALAVHADYEASVVKADVQNEVHTSTAGSAPIEIRFQNRSKGNITSWAWRFGRSGRAVDRDPFHVFTEIGTDTVSLKVINALSGCEHEMENPLVVTVMEALIEVPNTFTPNGDGVNDEFRVVYRSLKRFHITIHNRWGRKVYESDNPAEGWDGTVGGQLGAPGVYFYYIEAAGFHDNEEFRRHGMIHLIRGN